MKSSSSSATCCHPLFDYLLERIQFRKHDLTKKPFCLFHKNRTRSKVDYSLNKEKKKKKKKLHLVLDLDHTLLHSISLSQLSQKEKYLIEQVDSREDLWRFDKGHPTDFFIKLRPFLRGFLEEANKLFTMYVYTMGNSDYAKIVLNLIDPDKVYFGDRVITSRESPNKKTLDLLAVDQRRVVIVDDTRYVWPDHKRNLLQITRYIYFRDEFNSKSYAEDKRDESKSNGSLANVLKFLKNVHKRFEEELEGYKDTRLLIRNRCRQCCF